MRELPNAARKHTGDHTASGCLSTLLVEAGVRAIYFIATFIFALCVRFYPRGGRPPDIWEASWTLLAVPAGIALVVAAVGPAIYVRSTRRGRGLLSEVRKNSRRDR